MFTLWFKKVSAGALLAWMLLAGHAHAEISVEFDPERVEAGKPFFMSLVVPIRELPPERNGLPQLSELDGFRLTQTDSLDDVQTDFFMRGLKVRKYRFHLVAPKKEGRYTLKPLWEIGGVLRNLGSVSVQVQRPYDAPAMAAYLTPSKKKVYEGEQFALSLTLLTYPGWQGKAAPLSSDLGNDFVQHRSDMKDFQFVRSDKPGVEMEAKGYYAWVSPLRAGDLRIESLKFGYSKVGAPKVVEKKNGNFSFRSVTQEPEEATTSSSPVAITVLPLPTAGRPDYFNGMVGQYQFKGTVDKEQLQVGEAVTLTLTLRGNGKPGLIADPELPTFSEFRTVPPETKVTKTLKNGQIITEKVMRIFLYPKKSGQFTIPPIRFAWFDPNQKKYQTAETPEWVLQVEKGELTEMAATGGTNGWVSSPGKEIEMLGSDIRHIHELLGSVDDTVYYKKSVLWVLFVLPFMLLGLVSLFYKRHIQRLNDAVYQRRSQARKHLRIRLDEARGALQSGDAKKFHAALGNGLEGYMSDLLNQEFRGMTRDRVRSTLQQLKIAESILDGIDKILSDCDFARFAPVPSNKDQMEAQLRSTEALCRQLEEGV